MKRITLLSLLTLAIFNPLGYLSAQNISINTMGTPPVNSAILDLNSGNPWNSSNGKGLLVPCLTPGQIAGITPVAGLYVYNTACNVFEYYNGTAWIDFPSSTLATPGPITGLTSVCQGATGITYSVPVVAGTGVTYNWTLPTGASIASGANSNSITVDFGTSSGNICVVATNTCGTTSSYCTTVNTDASLNIAAVANPASVCSGSSSILAASGASTYSWLPTSSLSPTTGSTVTASPLVTTTYTVTGTSSTGCTSTQNVTVGVGSNNYWTNLVANGAAGSPGARYEVPGVWNTASNLMYIFGGYGGSFVNDFWQYAPGSPGTFTQLTAGGGPGTRDGINAVWDNNDGVFLVLDGQNGGCDNNFYKYAPGGSGTWTLLSPATSPNCRWSGGAVWDPTDQEMILFGGQYANAGNFFYNDVWVYSYISNTWTNSIANGTAGSPSIRATEQTSVWNSTNNSMYVFGGENGSGFLNDLWQYTPSTNTWVEVNNGLGTAPPVRWATTMVLDPVNNTLYLFGGDPSSGPLLGDLWAFSISGNAWTQLSPCGTGPSARYAQSAAWNSINNTMLIFGGNNGSFLNDVWQYTP